MTSTFHRRLGAGLARPGAILALAAWMLVAQAQPAGIDPVAQRLLKASTDFVASQQKFDVDTRIPNVLAVTPSLPAQSVKELIALAKARPGQIVYASTGVGSNAHFATELFKHMTGTDMLHVPYKGGGPALIDTIAGQAQVCLSSLIQAIGHIRSGKLRALATSSSKRSITMPELPTISEAGVPGYATANWWGIAAPHGTPPAVVNRLNEEIKVVLQTPDVEKRLIHEGAEPAIKAPADLGEYVAAEMAKWVRVAKIAGIRGE